MSSFKLRITILIIVIGTSRARFLKSDSIELLSDGLIHDQDDDQFSCLGLNGSFSFSSSLSSMFLSLSSSLSSSLKNCNHYYGFFHADNILEHIFQIMVYGFSSVAGERLLTKGSKVLFNIMGTGIFGPIFQILMVLPGIRDSGWSGYLSEAPLFQRQACEAAISVKAKNRRRGAEGFLIDGGLFAGVAGDLGGEEEVQSPAEKTSGAGFSWLIRVDRRWVSVENKGCRRSQRIRNRGGVGGLDRAEVWLRLRCDDRVRDGERMRVGNGVTGSDGLLLLPSGLRRRGGEEPSLSRLSYMKKINKSLLPYPIRPSSYSFAKISFPKIPEEFIA
ncbi:hypothetical protein U1Q18_009281 [Sarracenia purpurea var. burkii]